MTTLTETPGLPEAHFWLRGETSNEWVRFDPALGMWNVYGYAEVVRILGDPATFSSDVSEHYPMFGRGEANLLMMDPPDHRGLRGLLSRAFTPKVVADLEPRIVEVVTELLDALPNPDRLELVADLAHPLPVIVIAELLGVPSSDRNLFKKWVEDIMLLQNGQSVSAAEETGEQRDAVNHSAEQADELGSYLRQHVADRRRRPRADLLTGLVQAEVDGVRLSDDQVVGLAALVLTAGHASTTMLLGNTLLCLAHHPAAAERVRADRTLVPSVIEESLRFLSPGAGVLRLTRAPVEVDGVAIPAEQLLAVWLAAENRDPRQFPDPHTFDPARTPNPHSVSVGASTSVSAHRWPGWRAGSRSTCCWTGFPELRLDPQLPPQFYPSPINTGLSRLPLLTSGAT